MKNQITKKIACMVFAMTLSVSSMVPVPAEELETDIPAAGGTSPNPNPRLKKRWLLPNNSSAI